MRIVTLRALGLGDLLTAVPALRALRGEFPRAHMVLMTPAHLAELAFCTGAVDEVEPAAGLDGSPAPPADLAVNLHGRGPASTALLDHGAPAELWAFAGPGARAGAPAWWAGEHEVTRWCRLVAAQGAAPDPGDLAVTVPRAHAQAGTVVVHPGAASGARRWPAGRFAEVARDLSARGHPVVITGSVDEVPLARRVAALAGLPARAVLAGRTSPLQLAGVVAAARAVVCGDTGVGHLAVATATPSVAIFGPTSPAEWGPPPSPRHRVLWAGRTGDPHAPVPAAGLLSIGVAEVLEAVGDCLAASRGRARA